MKKLFKLLFLLFLIVGTVLIIRQQQSMPYQRNSGKIFGTYYNIIYQSDKDLHQEIVKALQKVDASLSMFNDSSTLSRINRNESTNVRDDKMFTDVFRLAERISKETDGAFDITVAPLVNAWGFGFKNDAPPTPRVVDSLLQIIGYDKVEVTRQGKVVKHDPRITLDCSAIAKGYGCDVVATLLEKNDVQNYMVEIGGEIVTCGLNTKRLPWRIGVTRPTEDSLQSNQELQAMLNVTDKAMATSGNYRNFYYRDGKKFAHTIDPKTGYPVQHTILSATVLTKKCAEADAYATSFMVMGLEKARKVLDRHPELMAYLIYTDDNGELATWWTPSLNDKIEE